MKTIATRLGASVITLLLIANAFAGSSVVTARAGGSTNDYGQSYGVGVTVPAGAAYSYHMFTFGSASGSAYVNTNGGGVSIYDTLSTQGTKQSSGTFPTGGLITGSVYAGVTDLYRQSTESSIGIYW